MTLHEFPDIAQRSPEWDALRRGMVTASTVGRLLTPTLKVANNETSRALTTALVTERLTGYSDPPYLNADMIRGIDMEPYAVARYSEHYHIRVDPMGFMIRGFDGLRLGYSPDGLAGPDGLIEVKCPRAKNHLATIVADEVPAEHMAQIQAGLLVSGREWCDYISYFAGMPMWVKRVEPDPDWHAAILDALDQFEVNAAVLAATYTTAIHGLATTEHIDLDEIRI